jgi:3-oxoacyl-[acyl-carrier-protein] synthase II
MKLPVRVAFAAAVFVAFAFSSSPRSFFAAPANLEPAVTVLSSPVYAQDFYSPQVNALVPAGVAQPVGPLGARPDGRGYWSGSAVAVAVVAGLAFAARRQRTAVLGVGGSKPKIVVTGIGVVSALGSEDEFWESLVNGKSGIAPITAFDASKFPTTIGAEVKDFDPKPYFKNAKTVKSIDRFAHLAVAASKMAIEDGGFDTGSLDAADKKRFGCIVGSGIGGIDTFEKQTLNLDRGKKMSPFTIPALLTNTASGIIGIELGCMGPNFSVASACAAGSHAIGEALRFLQNGEADVMLTGGTEAAITPVSFGGFCAMKAMCSMYNDTPQEASRPFDAGRAGFVMGEGAGVLLLETEEHALKRGAKIYCELAGYAATCDAHHITTPHPEGMGLSDCLAGALADANCPPEDVAYINAHGTSTPYNDKFETMAIKTVFGDHAQKLAISSTKSMTGHTLGAAGGIEGAIACKVLQTGVAPPTINYNTPDPECDLNYVPNKAQTLESPKAVISDNLGFGGHNAALVFKAYEGEGVKK